ncbi:T9SS type A sorting domain-containing protein [candidate division KSB1 bacterium]|nr:T9SS type A sorting domain-containing protein [candidate division KSB1 bacterium]
MNNVCVSRLSFDWANLLKPIVSQLFLLSLMIPCYTFAQQVDISRIERMPNRPAPYEMRNWKQVALGYDSLVFNFDLTGEYLPLIRWNTAPVNYPEHNSFTLHTAVGTNDPAVGEAINVLPAVISASLVGIDKSDQNGVNWVLMCEEFFNNRLRENVYLNNPDGKSGSDWWYDTMPNIFFYQLYDLYPGTGDFDYQFCMVADRWLEAVTKMGGSTAPWKKPYMNYRAWSLSTMTPLSEGVKQPEAAGAIGWLLYNAYIVTGEEKYRIGAEWCLEFLNEWAKNPSYELQLPYGVYAAARMNAEIGTNYDIEKMINWCFDTRDNIRDWGATLGNWNGYDCYGLIGEARYTGYAFIMNGFEHAGALVPLVRYDERFARAIGKWMLNLAQASRYFYPNYLPDDHQDSDEWAHVYDPDSYIAHEAMRQYALNSGTSPYATGDFIREGWGHTNLVLYGSSHVGIFGGIIDTTNVEMILKLNVNRTDYFQDTSLPSFLYFNPYDEVKTVQIDVGDQSIDLYDVVSHAFLATGATGEAEFDIPADAVMLLVLVPSDAVMTYDGTMLLANGKVVDYHADQNVSNHPPRIKSLAPALSPVLINSETQIYCTAEDADGDTLSYLWTASGGSIQGEGDIVSWLAPAEAGVYEIKCAVTDSRGIDVADSASASVSISVLEYINHPPEITALRASKNKAYTGETIVLNCTANDTDGDELTYLWHASQGTLESDGSVANWICPMVQDYYMIRCTVQDTHGAQASDSLGIVVLDPSSIEYGVPIAHYPFNGNAHDESGFGHHGTIFGPVPIEDRLGNADAAYYFDGFDDFIKVRNTDILNCENEISVCLWLNVEEFFSNEMYPISHGNWENRWKISINPDDHRVRWTVKTDAGIKDMDSKLQLSKDRFYFLVTMYDGAHMKIYVDGILDNTVDFNGSILTTDIDLTIGRVLPTNTCCNFKGILDEVRIYSYALSEEELMNLYDMGIGVTDKVADEGYYQFSLRQNYPNPFNLETRIQFSLQRPEKVNIMIYDILGRRVKQLLDTSKSAGIHSINWDGRNDDGIELATGIYVCSIRAGEFKDTIKLLLLK